MSLHDCPLCHSTGALCDLCRVVIGDAMAHDDLDRDTDPYVMILDDGTTPDEVNEPIPYLTPELANLLDTHGVASL